MTESILDCFSMNPPTWTEKGIMKGDLVRIDGEFPEEVPMRSLMEWATGVAEFSSVQREQSS